MIITGGFIKCIQSFKGLVTEIYDEWLANGVQEATEQGTLKRPPRKLFVEWIMDA